MRPQELAELLIENGFKEEKLDSGCNYTKKVGPIEFISYIEPDIEVEFISIYKWDNNDVKGTYNIPLDKLRYDKESVATIFRKTKNNLPQYIGEKIDTHRELEKAIEDTFGE